MSNANPNDWNTGIINQFRANGGKITGGPMAGAPLVLLTTTGARTGRKLTSPLMYNTDGDRILVFASKGGAPTHPDWYYNVLANPEVTVELGTETFQARATVLQGEERDRLYRRHAEQYPNFATYQENTSRIIPVIALERIK